LEKLNFGEIFFLKNPLIILTQKKFLTDEFLKNIRRINFSQQISIIKHNFYFQVDVKWQEIIHSRNLKG